MANGDVKQREPRYRVMLPARVRWDGAWKAASVRNVSAHGLLLCSPEIPPAGTYVELLVGEETITARAIWSGEQVCGLRARDRLNFDRLKGSSACQQRSCPVGGSDAGIDRHRAHDDHHHIAEQSRALSYIMQYLTALLVGMLLAGGVGWGTYRILSAPFSTISLAMSDGK